MESSAIRDANTILNGVSLLKKLAKPPGIEVGDTSDRLVLL